MSIEKMKSEVDRGRNDRAVPSEKDICEWSDIEEAVLGLLTGDLTLAQLEGVSAQQLYAAAKLGRTLLDEGKLDGARKIFTGLRAYNPVDPYFHAMLGSIAQRERKLEEAISHYAAASKYGPEEVSSWTNQGEVMLLRATELKAGGDTGRAGGLFLRAVNCLRRAALLDPTGQSGPGRRARLLITATAAICVGVAGTARA